MWCVLVAWLFLLDINQERSQCGGYIPKKIQLGATKYFGELFVVMW
jgi:hypothetical protein